MYRSGGKAVRTNPLWFRGYVLLATICQHTLARQEAITTLKTGAKICQVCLRYLARQSCTLVMQGAISRELQSRITRQIMTVMQYEDILRHQLAFALVEYGRYDEALLWWTKRRGEHHA